MTFSRIRCLTGHFVDRTLDPPEGNPLGATGYTNHEVDKGLVSVIVCGWFATIILKSSNISHFAFYILVQDLILVPDLVKEWIYPEF